ncbi:MAG TPA: hypothetical protein VKQ31_03960, partial [Steroidobacteraceae bacterium]|nr:hypothetical protein [Steroidobacteraceae bacterium]
PARASPSLSTQPTLPARGPRASDSFVAERLLLDAARTALASDRLAAALEATAQHEREYPDGAMVQEREAIAIRALVGLGRSGEARERVARFRARFPESVLLPAVEAAAGAESLP